MDNIKIRERGLLQDYRPDSTHRDIIYFSTNTGEILLNGKQYGSAKDSTIIYAGMYDNPLELEHLDANKEVYDTITQHPNNSSTAVPRGVIQWIDYDQPDYLYMTPMVAYFVPMDDCIHIITLDDGDLLIYRFSEDGTISKHVEYAHWDRVQDELDQKVDKIIGKGLSTNDFTDALKSKLESLRNYDDTSLKNKINTLETNFNTLLNSNPDEAINSFNEIIAFLENIEDSSTLEGIIAGIETQIASINSTLAKQTPVIKVTQQQFDSIQDKDPNVLYYISDLKEDIWYEGS